MIRTITFHGCCTCAKFFAEEDGDWFSAFVEEIGYIKFFLCKSHGVEKIKIDSLPIGISVGGLTREGDNLIPIDMMELSITEHKKVDNK